MTSLAIKYALYFAVVSSYNVLITELHEYNSMIIKKYEGLICIDFIYTLGKTYLLNIYFYILL